MKNNITSILTADAEKFEFQVTTTLNSQFWSLIIVTIAIAVVFFIYYVKISNIKKNLYPRSFAFLFQIYIEFIHNLLLQILGPKFDKLTPYFIYLFTYILFCNTISIFGLESPTSSLTIAISLGLVTWIGIFVVGFKFQQISFLQKYTFNIKVKGKTIPVMINPLNVFSQFAPLISISFRLWGNIFAGGMILTMVMAATNLLSNALVIFSIFDIFGAIVLIPLHAYFDLLSGVVQTFVFCLLTMIYWKLETKELEAESNDINVDNNVNNNPQLNINANS